MPVFQIKKLAIVCLLFAFTVCNFKSVQDEIVDRFISGQIEALHLDNAYMHYNYKSLSPFVNTYVRDCNWGYFLTMKHDDITGQMVYKSGFILRF